MADTEYIKSINDKPVCDEEARTGIEDVSAGLADVAAKAVQADWSENDPESPAYVKNRVGGYRRNEEERIVALPEEDAESFELEVDGEVYTFQKISEMLVSPSDWNGAQFVYKYSFSEEEPEVYVDTIGKEMLLNTYEDEGKPYWIDDYYTIIIAPQAVTHPSGVTIPAGAYLRSSSEEFGEMVTVMLPAYAKIHQSLLDDNIQNELNEIEGEIEIAQATAETAQATAETAQATAETAQATAETAQATAEIAQATAETAQATAEIAQATAEEAKTTAEEAKTTAEEAKTTAEEAKTTAESKLDKTNPTAIESFTLGSRVSGTIGTNSFASGTTVEASGIASHAEGNATKATGINAHAEGSSTKATGINAHAEGGETTASGDASHAEGSTTKATGHSSHAEGIETATTASGAASHAEGRGTTTSGDASHAEGNGTKATGTASHAEGSTTKATGINAHAEGDGTTASGYASHAEGNGTTASGYASHAEGNGTTASGNASHAEGRGTTASGSWQHVEGRYNVEDNTTQSDLSNGQYMHIVGNGTSSTSRSNAHTLDRKGNAWYAGDVYVGSTSGTNKDDGSVKLAKVTETVSTADSATEATEFYLKSSTADSTKRFRITVDDSGAITATEVVG